MALVMPEMALINESGTNGGKVPLNKEQIQLENLLQIIEKSPYKWTFE